MLSEKGKRKEKGVVDRLLKGPEESSLYRK